MEQINLPELTDNDFYTYIGSNENDPQNDISKKLKIFSLVIHPDKCEINKLKEIFKDNPYILNFIETNERNKQIVCNSLFQLFQNKYDELFQNVIGDDISDENQEIIEKFTNFSQALLNAEIWDYLAILSATSLSCYLNENPDLILDNNDIEQINSLLRNFKEEMIPFTSKIFTIVQDNGDQYNKYPIDFIEETETPQQGGSDKSILIRLIVIFILSFITSVQCSLVSSKFVVSPTTPQTYQIPPISENSVLKNGNVIMQGLYQFTSVFHKGVEALEHGISAISHGISKESAKGIYKVFSSFLSKIDEKNNDALQTIKTEDRNIETYKLELKNLQDENANQKISISNSSLMIELSKKLIASHENKKFKNFEYLQGIFLKVLIDNLFGKKNVNLNTNFVEIINEIIGYTTLGTNTNQNIINTISKIMASYYSEVCSNIKCPLIKTPDDFYKNYLTDFILFGKESAIAIKGILNDILGEKGFQLINELQESYAEKNRVKTFGKTGSESFTEIELNNLLQSQIKAILTDNGTKFGVIIKNVFSINEMLEKYGHYVYLFLNVINLADTGFQTLSNLRNSNDLYFESLELIKPEKRTSQQLKKIAAKAGVIGAITSFSGIIQESQKKNLPTKISEVTSSLLSRFINFVNLQKPLTNDELLDQNTLYKSLIENKYLVLDDNGNADFQNLLTALQKFAEKNVIDSYKKDFVQLITIVQNESESISTPSNSISLSIKANITEAQKASLGLVVSTNDLIKLGFNISKQEMLKGSTIVLKIGEEIVVNLFQSLASETQRNLSQVIPELNNMIRYAIKEASQDPLLLTMGGKKKKNFTKKKNKYNKTKKLHKKKKSQKKSQKKYKNKRIK